MAKHRHRSSRTADVGREGVATMCRMFAAGGVSLAVLVCAGLCLGQDKAGDDPGKAADELLKAKDLQRSGAMYVVRGEESVKKAAEAAEARLKEYRLTVARESGALREGIQKGTMAANLTKQRDELKKQIDQATPQIQEQLQGLRQQQNAVQMQINSMQGGNNKFARMQVNQLQAQSRQLGAQMNMVQAQGNELNAAYTELGNQIKQLSSSPDTASDEPSKGAARRPAATSDDRKEAYIKAIAAVRKEVDEVKPKYDALGEDAEVSAALETLSQRSGKIKYTLGPSKKFLDTIKALEQAEARVASGVIVEEPKAAESVKRKTKTAKKK